MGTLFKYWFTMPSLKIIEHKLYFPYYTFLKLLPLLSLLERVQFYDAINRS